MIQICPLLPKIKPKRSEIQKFKSLIFHLPVNANSYQSFYLVGKMLRHWSVIETELFIFVKWDDYHLAQYIAI